MMQSSLPQTFHVKRISMVSGFMFMLKIDGSDLARFGNKCLFKLAEDP